MSVLTHARPLVFDLDGTLIDSRRDIANAANFALEALGRSALPVETVTSFVGNGAPYLLEQLSLATDPHGDKAQGRDLLAPHFQKYYLAHPVDFSTVLPGVPEALRLSGRQMALCTNKPRNVTELVVAGLGWGETFAAVVAAGDTVHKKPHGEPLELVARLLGVPPNTLIMIGDGPQDIEAGKAVGAHTVGVRGGLLPEEYLEASAPDVILHDLRELGAYLESMGL